MTSCNTILFILSAFAVSSLAQQPAGIPLSSDSFVQWPRYLTPVPKGRVRLLDDVYIRHFEWIEHVNDYNVQYLMKAYTKNGGYNILLLDWSNFAYGSYVLASLNMYSIADKAAAAIQKLVNNGVPLETLHLVGHSLGAHLLALVCRKLSKRIRIKRLSILDAAYPGFYPPILGNTLMLSDVDFVDVIHTDGGGYGAPDAIGHADFWPNGGKAKQPGCLSGTILLTGEDLCSHWRSHQFWAESLSGGEFLARRCNDFDTFLRGNCSYAEVALMGVRATPDLRGNFYLRTAAKKPFAIGEKGAE